MHLLSMQVETSSKQLGLGPGAVGYMRAGSGDTVMEIEMALNALGPHVIT